VALVGGWEVMAMKIIQIINKVQIRRAYLFMLAALLMVALFPLKTAEAASCDTTFYQQNDVLYYDPCSTTCGGSSGNGGTAEVSKLRGANNGDKIYNFWIDAGLSAQQSAGVTGSMQHEGGFSPFRQEMGKSWPNWGYGIAQFTGQPAPNHPDTGGERAAVIAYLKADSTVGPALFTQYYQAQYGGSITGATGYVPQGVPQDVNDKFLLSELNYLLGSIKKLVPSTIPDRVNGLRNNYNQTVSAGQTLYAYLKTLSTPSAAAAAWTYLYEYGGLDTIPIRQKSAETIFSMNGTGTGGGTNTTTSCGGNLVAGGMALQAAKEFMDSYSNGSDSVNYIGGAAQGCTGGPLSNCVSFSVYFINKYTTLQGFGAGTTPGNGSTLVANIVARNPGVPTGHSPRPYAIFSVASGKDDCDGVPCGHTGVILGVDTANGKVIVGEAACSSPASWDGAHVYPLSQFENDAYTYAYTDSYLKGTLK
jgi:hypothetical protein